MIGKGIRGGVVHAIHKYAKTNNKFMENYNKDITSPYLMYIDANNFYSSGMSQELPVKGFKRKKNVSESDKALLKRFDRNSDKGYILEVDVEYPKSLYNLHSGLSFLAETKEIKKCNKLVCNIYEKGNYVVHIRVLKQAFNHGLILKKYIE